MDRIADDNALAGFEDEEAPVAFLDSLVLGEVNDFQFLIILRIF